jgi:hypothetical protein
MPLFVLQSLGFWSSIVDYAFYYFGENKKGMTSLLVHENENEKRNYFTLSLGLLSPPP